MPVTRLDPEREAQAILDTSWIRSGFELALPVDPTYIANELGIKVFRAGLDADISGILKKRPGMDAEIYLQASDSRNRQRFTCAHELGHYVARSAEGDDDWEYVEHRALLASQGTDESEIFANQFAAHLLMPRKELETSSFQSTIAALALKFGVSEDAMNFHLDNLRPK